MTNDNCKHKLRGLFDSNGRGFVKDISDSGLYGSDSRCTIVMDGEYKDKKILNINDEFFIFINYCPFCGLKL